MSFILDALKKSENERQQVTPAEFASVPSSPAASRTPVWLWLLGALLIINTAVLAGFMLRSPAPAAAALSANPQPGPLSAGQPEPVAVRSEPPAAEPAASFTERVALARTGRQPVVEGEAPAGETAPEPGATGAPVETAPAPSPESADPFLPSMDELRMQGALSLPDLHVDIHVYSEVPADRFVFINMNKYRQADRLSEGPVIREITRDGVVLEHRGNVFVLPRE